MLDMSIPLDDCKAHSSMKAVPCAFFSKCFVCSNDPSKVARKKLCAFFEQKPSTARSNRDELAWSQLTVYRL
jgi:hypothetical protein